VYMRACARVVVVGRILVRKFMIRNLFLALLVTEFKWYSTQS